LVRVAPEQRREGELHGVGTGREVLHGGHLVDLGPVGAPAAVHDHVDALGHQRVERRERQVARRVGELADEAQAGERLASRPGVDGGVPGHAGRQGEEQREGLPVPHLADHRDVGRHAQEPGDQPTQVDRRPVGTPGPGLHARHVRQRDVGLEDLLGHHDPQRGVELGQAAGHEGGLARPRRPGEHHGEAGADAGPQERRHLRRQHPALHQLVDPLERDPGELADVHHHVAAAGDVAVDDVQSGAVVELGILQALGGIEGAVGRGAVVEDLGERAQHVLVVVEDLVVVSRRPTMALHEDRVRGVDHDLPHVVVGQEGLERPVAGDVAEGALDDQLGVGQVERAQASSVVEGPAADLVLDEGAQLRLAVGPVHLEGDVLGPLLDPPLDLLER
jgi:hypothetical protein